MGVLQTVILCIGVLSCGSWRFPFANYKLEMAEMTSATMVRSRTMQSYTLGNSQSSSQEKSKGLQKPGMLFQSNGLIEVEKTRMARSVSENTGTSTSSAGINANPFRDPTIRFIRLYRFWQPSFVSETVTSENWYGSEATVEFKPSLRSLQNITRANLNVTVSVDEDSSEVPILLLGSFYLITAGTTATTRRVADFVSLGQIALPKINAPATTKVSFPITDFIKRASSSFGSTTPVRSQKVLIVFLVRRQCNSINSSECTSLLRTDSEVPYLKVDYRQSN